MSCVAIFISHRAFTLVSKTPLYLHLHLFQIPPKPFTFLYTNDNITALFVCVFGSSV